jgi:microcystin-dependent protein
MSDPFIGEIRLVGFNFAPHGWAFCNGQLLQIAQNTALFSLLGTTYGGNGQTTFGLPNLQGRAPMSMGTGPGLTPRTLGQTGGATSVTLTISDLAVHTHAPMGVASNDASSPAGHAWGNAGGGRTPTPVYQNGDPNVPMKQNLLDPAGNASPQPHNNMQPYLAANFVIALTGIYPARE